MPNKINNNSLVRPDFHIPGISPDSEPAGIQGQTGSVHLVIR